jgi:quercetin dioxygenase-like cupin family protein
MVTALSHVHSLPWRDLPEPGWDGVREKALVSLSKEFAFGFVEAQPGAHVPRHAHRQAETDYVLTGSARLRTKGRVVDVRPGSNLYFAPGAPHELEVIGADPLVYLRAFACERNGPPAKAIVVADAPEPVITAERDVDWRSVESSKGMRIRVQRLLDHGVEMMAGIGELDPGVHYTRHYHDQPELYFILAGEGVLQGAEAETEIGPGTAVYLGSREIHGLDSVGQEPLRLVWVYGCEMAGHQVNWTPVEPIYAEARRRTAAR